jgi:hypothetical protein
MHWRNSPRLGMAGALLVSITVIGVWHGAKWGYLVFGVMNACFVIGSTFTLPWRDAFWKKRGVPLPALRVPRAIATVFLFLLTLVAFRENTLHDAGIIYRDIFSGELFRNFGQAIQWFGFHHGTPMSLPGLNRRPFLLIPVLILGDLLVARGMKLEKLPVLLQMALYGLAVIEIASAWMDTYVPQPFVYNKF